MLIAPLRAMIGANSMQSILMERPHVAESQRRRRAPKRQDDEQTEPEFPHVAEALRNIRKAFKLTQEQMAPIFGLSFAGYRPYERGERFLTHAQIERMAAALNVSPSEITSHLWPDDENLVETRYSLNFEEFKRDAATLPRNQAEGLLRRFKALMDIEKSLMDDDLAQRN